MTSNFDLADDDGLPFFGISTMAVTPDISITNGVDSTGDGLPFLVDFETATQNDEETAIASEDVKNRNSLKPTFQPHLPAELLVKIVNIAHQEHKTSIVPLMRVSKTFNAIVEPMLYDTIHLTERALAKLPACILSKPNADPIIQASHDRKMDMLSRTTKLVIGDIPLLFQKRSDRDLVKFCQKVVLPNVTMVEWREKHPNEWTKEDWAKNRGETPPVSTIPGYRADLFRAVLPAENKTMCLKVPKNGLFRNIGGSLRNLRGQWRQKFHFTTTMDRMMEYISGMSGRVEIRIHQCISKAYFCLGGLKPIVDMSEMDQVETFQVAPKPRSPETIYHFYPGREELPAKAKIIQAYSRLASHHLLPILLYGREDRQMYRLLYQTEELLTRDISQEEQAREAKRIVDAWSSEPESVFDMNITWKYVTELILGDFFQAAAALRAEGATNPCPCCGETGVAF
jgi:hypothetical protein